MIKEEKIEFTTRWCRYSKYRIEEKENKLYILPDENSKPITYDPFDFRNEILRDLLVIGKEAMDRGLFKMNDRNLTAEVQSKMGSFQKLVINFVTNYGLLGNFRYLPADYDFMDNEDIPVKLGYNKIATAKEFEKRYFIFDKKIDWSKSMDANDFTRNSGFDADFNQIEGDRLNDIIFSKNYAETLAEIIMFAEEIYDLKYLISAYLYDDASEDIKDVYKSSIEAKSLEKSIISYGIKNNQIQFEWKFMSLSAAIDTMLLLNETNDRKEVKLCKYCGNPFIAENIKSEYDTLSCRNKANINKSRNKKK
jgi:hypothetical protein